MPFSNEEFLREKPLRAKQRKPQVTNDFFKMVPMNLLEGRSRDGDGRTRFVDSAGSWRGRRGRDELRE